MRVQTSTQNLLLLLALLDTRLNRMIIKDVKTFKNNVQHVLVDLHMTLLQESVLNLEPNRELKAK